MALVPFRTRGPAANQSSEERLIQICGLAIVIRQNPSASMERKDGGRAGDSDNMTWVENTASVLAEYKEKGSSSAASVTAAAGLACEVGSKDSGSAKSVALVAELLAAPVPPPPPVPSDRLGSVGLVAWQCGELLATFLLDQARRIGAGWHGVRVVDLGCGTGIVGIAMALAGASVTLTDLAHVLPLAEANAKVNCERHGVSALPETKEHAWGDRETGQSLRHPSPPDLITASGEPSCCVRHDMSDLYFISPSFVLDVLYNPSYYSALLDSLMLLCAPHTLVYIAWKKRHAEEESFIAMAEGRGFVIEQVRDCKRDWE